MTQPLPQNRIQRLRHAAGLSQHKLAVELDVHPSTIQRWETGTTPVSDEDKALLADFFGVSVPYLAGWVSEEGLVV